MCFILEVIKRYVEDLACQASHMYKGSLGVLEVGGVVKCKGYAPMKKQPQLLGITINLANLHPAEMKVDFQEHTHAMECSTCINGALCTDTLKLLRQALMYVYMYVASYPPFPRLRKIRSVERLGTRLHTCAYVYQWCVCM